MENSEWRLVLTYSTGALGVMILNKMIISTNNFGENPKKLR
jgi:hypothetical protein